MLENIVQTEKESAEFEKYKALKGEYLYKQVSDILFELDGKPAFLVWFFARNYTLVI